MEKVLNAAGLTFPENQYNVNNVYKLHLFDSNGNVTKIFIFCAKTMTQDNLKELISDLELSLHEINGVEYVFSDQLIHPDDSIRVLKKKIIAEMGMDSIAYEELYLFGFVKRIDFILCIGVCTPTIYHLDEQIKNNSIFRTPTPTPQ